MTYALVKETLADKTYLAEYGSLAGQEASAVAITGGTITGITDLAVADGGTGASTAAGARTNLGLGTMATQAATAVNIDGGTIDGAVIGGASAAAATFTTIEAASGNFSLGGTFLEIGTFDTAASTDGFRIANAQNDPLRTSRSGAGAQAHWRFHDASGGVAGSIITDGAGNTSFNTTSDERLKTNRQPIEDVGHIVDAIEVVRYDMNGKSVRGLSSAQELYAVFPEAVTPGTGEPGDEGFVPWSVDPSKLVPLLVAELQLLRARVANLESLLR